ncbi:MAG: D-alanyl-D-alanine carboxypeptidase [Eubacterium sp.]|nr:D-alanyl-D-alanine carboxypeptidase [Eubacterium sp.]CDE18699.1 putative uncharacterized protein [Eubacterium sp. CAG:841]
MIKKFTSAIIFIAFIFSVCVSAAPSPGDSSLCSVVVEAESGDIIFEKNAHERRGPASTTKIMTALVALENSRTDDIVKIDPRAVGTEGSSAYLCAGEKVLLSDLLYAVMLGSANDAAAAIAYHIGGSIEGFAEMMNARAEKLGLSDTHFENPHGLDGESHYTTAYDLAMIAREALKNENFRNIVSTKTKAVKLSDGNVTRVFKNHNRLLFEYDDIIGVKTGFTKKCGRTLVSAAERDGVTVICVTLCDGDDWRDHRKLLSAGLELYERVTLCEKGGEERIVHVCGGEKASVGVCCDEKLSVTLSKPHGKTESVTELPPFVYAGFEKGDTLGFVSYYLDGKPIGRVALVAKEGSAVKLKKKNIFGK